MPNLKAEMDKRDGGESLTISDGNIYYLPMLDETPRATSRIMSAPTAGPADWKRPVTIEDWGKTTGRSSKTTDPKRQRRHEIPFSAYETSYLRNFSKWPGAYWDDFYTDH